jgi:anti-anti-sigma factor
MIEVERIARVAAVEVPRHTVVVTISERMDIFNAPPLMQHFNALLDQGAMYFIVDLSAVRIVDVDGDYPLLHLLKRAQEVDGGVSLVCPIGNPIRTFYEMMRLDTLFEMAETLEIALADLGLSPE